LIPALTAIRNLKVGFSSLVNLVLKDAQACEEQPVSFSVFC
jgi:hypothetical protein